MSSFWINAAIDLLLVIYVIDCAFMGLVIMMQRSKQEGLGAAFGGGFTQDIFGAQTSQVLVKATTIAAALFFVLSITLARLYTMRESSTLAETSIVQQSLEKTPAPGAAPTNAAPVTTPVPAPSPTPAVPSATVTAPSASATSTHAPAPAAPAALAPKPSH